MVTNLTRDSFILTSVSPLDNVDDGTQTSPAVTDVPHQEEIIEAGCQVTPSLDVPAATETRKSLNNFTGVGSVSDGKIPLHSGRNEASRGGLNNYLIVVMLFSSIFP